MNSGSWWWTGRPGVLRFIPVTKSRTWLSDWTELNWTNFENENFILHLCISQTHTPGNMRSSIPGNKVILWFTSQGLSLVPVITGSRGGVGRPPWNQEFTQSETAYVRSFFRVKIIFDNFQHMLTTSAPILGQFFFFKEKKLLERNKLPIQK